MWLALQKTYDAVPAPKIAIATGACAISGGPFRGHPEVHDGVTGTCRWISSSPAARRTR
jgi:Ni,Fe-hydrogenase III small subunit